MSNTNISHKFAHHPTPFAVISFAAVLFIRHLFYDVVEFHPHLGQVLGHVFQEVYTVSLIHVISL